MSLTATAERINGTTGTTTAGKAAPRAQANKRYTLMVCTHFREPGWSNEMDAVRAYFPDDTQIRYAAGPEVALAKHSNAQAWAQAAWENGSDVLGIVVHVGCQYYARHLGTKKNPAGEPWMRLRRGVQLYYGFRSLRLVLRAMPSRRGRSLTASAWLLDSEQTLEPCTPRVFTRFATVSAMQRYFGVEDAADDGT